MRGHLRPKNFLVVEVIVNANNFEDLGLVCLGGMLHPVTIPPQTGIHSKLDGQDRDDASS